MNYIEVNQMRKEAVAPFIAAGGALAARIAPLLVSTASRWARFGRAFPGFFTKGRAAATAAKGAQVAGNASTALATIPRNTTTVGAYRGVAPSVANPSGNWFTNGARGVYNFTGRHPMMTEMALMTGGSLGVSKYLDYRDQQRMQQLMQQQQQMQQQQIK